MEFKDRLKELRMKAGFSQEELAVKVGLKKAAINKYETGIVVNPKRSLIEKIASILDTTPAYLMGWDEKSEDAKRPVSSLTESDMREVRREAEKIKDLLLAGTSLAFDGEIEDEDTLNKVMAALESGMMLAKEEAKRKYTPKKFRKPE